jgi:hypothetical protein
MGKPKTKHYPGLADVDAPERVFKGDNETKKEFLLKVINAEIKDSYGMQIPSSVRLKAFQMYCEMENAENEANRNKSSVINITVGTQGASFNESILKEPVNKEEEESIEV